MRTTASSIGLAEALWPRSRRQVLALLLLAPEREWHLREIARRARVSPAAAQREVTRLAAVGILRRRTEPGRSYYRANPSCPVFAELRQILTRTMSIADVLRDALLSLEGLHLAFVFGSAARDEEAAGEIGLVIVTNAPSGEIADRVRFAERRLNREITPSVYSAEEFRSKLAKRDRLLLRLLSGPRIPIVGEAEALADASGAAE